jgi:hypothetical protein
MSETAILQEPATIDDILHPTNELTTHDETFVVDTEEKATWAARRILQAQTRIAERGHLAKTYKARIDQWLEEASKPDTETINTLSSFLDPFLRQELESIHRRKSIKLLGATIGFRTLPRKVDIINPEQAIDFCETHYPDAVIVKKDLSRSELRKLAESGTLIPGVVLDGGMERLYVKESK